MSHEVGGADQVQLPTIGSATPHSTAVGRLGVSRRRGGLVALIALSSLTCLYGLGSGPPMGDHECINAVAARQSFESGSWLIPELDNAPWIRKTPLGIWLIEASSSLIGQPDGALPVTDLSARLPSALAGMANVFVVFWLGSMLYGHRGGLVAGFICAGSVATVMFSRNPQVDMVLTLFTTLSFGCFWRGAMHPQPSKLHMASFFLMFALAMLAKAPLPLAMIGLSLAAYWFIALPLLAATEQGERSLEAIARRSIRDWRESISGLRKLWLMPGVLVFLVVVGAWPVYVYTHVDNALALWRGRVSCPLYGRAVR
ncbi:MAG: glycosyltransferase family 39 protein [Planctomycetes bacterium]|nr:glycosyltransferase family 39 protein [Planctomycetota bacterium]